MTMALTAAGQAGGIAGFGNLAANQATSITSRYGAIAGVKVGGFNSISILLLLILIIVIISISDIGKGKHTE